MVGSGSPSREVVVGYAECCNDCLATAKVVLRVLIHHGAIRGVAIAPTVQPGGLAQGRRRLRSKLRLARLGLDRGSAWGVRDGRPHRDELVAVRIPNRTRTDSGPNLVYPLSGQRSPGSEHAQQCLHLSRRRLWKRVRCVITREFQAQAVRAGVALHETGDNACPHLDDQVLVGTLAKSWRGNVGHHVQPPASRRNERNTQCASTVRCALRILRHRGRTAGYPTAPAPIPACRVPAPGSSGRLAAALRPRHPPRPFAWSGAQRGAAVRPDSGAAAQATLSTCRSAAGGDASARWTGVAWRG